MNFGSILFVALVAIFFIALALGMTVWGLIPIVVIAFAALFAAPIAALMKKADVGRGAEPAGVPSTTDAAYEPMIKPDEQAASH